MTAAPMTPTLGRRALLAAGAGIVVSFSLRARAEDAGPPGSLKATPLLDSWMRLAPDGHVTVFTGKAELGQGIRTALIQVAAEELMLPPARIILVTADTAQTPDEGFTAGSHSMQDSGTAILHAAAQLRAALVEQASAWLGAPVEQLVVRNGLVRAPDGRGLSYADVAEKVAMHVPVQPGTGLVPPASFTVIGTSLPRVDIPAKVTGGPAYVQDMRLQGTVHGRVVRPPRPGARLMSVDAAAVEAMPGVLRVVRDGSFLAVVAANEHQAVLAMRALAAAARWDGGTALPDPATLADWLQAQPAQDQVILDRPAASPPGGRTIQARYTRPYLLHGSIGPSCAVARMDGDGLTVWTHTQGVFPLRAALAEMLGLPPAQVHCIHREGSGCYGHNGADDVAADAAILARALPGRAVRVQWMRETEHGWEPYSSAMATEASATLDADGRIADWQYAVWSMPHNNRPGGAGALLAAQMLAQPFAPPVAKEIPMPEGGGDRNAVPIYRLPAGRVVDHFVPAQPLRTSAQRSLGAHVNVFSIESFMDELADAANADPVEFRLRHLDDPRARAVVEMAAQRFGWADAAKLPPGHGRGFAFARYKNLAAYCAVALEAEVERDTGRIGIGRVVAAVDCGQAVNPDGVRNQIEGAIVQSASWTMFEAVRFDRDGGRNRDWGGYPILRFSAVPAEVTVHILDRPGAPFLGTGEAGQGPAAAAIANALRRATGLRMRDLPLSPDRVRAALNA